MNLEGKKTQEAKIDSQVFFEKCFLNWQMKWEGLSERFMAAAASKVRWRGLLRWVLQRAINPQNLDMSQWDTKESSFAFGWLDKTTFRM